MNQSNHPASMAGYPLGDAYQRYGGLVHNLPPFQNPMRPSPLVDMVMRQSQGYYPIDQRSQPWKLAKRTTPNIPIFGGRKDRMSWESFVKRFMEAQRMMGSVSPQDDFDLMRFLEFSLDDLALKAYESVWPSCTSFVQLVEQIEVRIASREDPSCAAQKITMLKKGNDEGWMEFSMKVQDLFVKAYPGVAPDLIQGMAGEKFFGFYPALWRDKAWMLDVPHDLASMVKFAKKLTREDEYRTQEKDPHAEKDKEVTAGDSKKTNPEGEKKGNKSNNRNDKGQFGKKFPDKNTGDSQPADPSPDGDSKTGNAQTNKPTGRNGAPLSCYNCKKTGHFKRDCTVWCRDKQCPPDHHLVRNCPVLIKYYEDKMKQMPPPV